MAFEKNDVKKRSTKDSFQKSSWIHIVGAREHNLKNISVSIPKNTLTVITGPSGSGKSSLALDVLYTEGKRRYMESLSSYARQFLGIVKKPDFDSIEGLCPAIAIEQKTVGHNPRSTVGTITEIYDYLRVFFARIGTPYCPTCQTPIVQQSAQQVSEHIMSQFASESITLIAPLVLHQKGEFKQLLTDLHRQGYTRFIIDDKPYNFKHIDEINPLALAKTYKHTILALVDMLTVSPDEHSRIVEGVEKAFALAKGLAMVRVGEQKHIFSSKRMCVTCGYSVQEIEPRIFSFNSPIGACKHCNGLGIEPISFDAWSWVDPEKNGDSTENQDDDQKINSRSVFEKACSVCLGKRLNKQALSVLINGKSIADIAALAIDDIHLFMENLLLADQHVEIAHTLVVEIKKRLSFLINVGLGYLTLSRMARTLSGGEGQRIRLATQIGSALSGVLYVLDEPSIGLHQRDNERLINTLKMLRDYDNTVAVVEHDLDTMEQADFIIDMGPGAGINGGRVVAAGTPEELMQNPASLSGQYLSGKKNIPVPQKRRSFQHVLTVYNAQKNNLKNVTVSLPLGVLSCITGVSGSGKSTLVFSEFVPLIKQALGSGSGYVRGKKTTFDSERISGIEHIQSLVVIDQSPIGRTSRSNPATYLGIFDEIRKLFAQLPDSKARGFTVSRFSFNVAEGRCFECSGEGSITVSMQFLADVVTTCKTCNGKRYNAETLQIKYSGKNIADVLAMSVYEAVSFFSAHKVIHKKLMLLCDIGLDYLALGQPSPTLSGGESQRIKLADELSKRGQDTIYFLDEPTTGLHTHDIVKFLLVVNRLVEKGNTIVLIEHNLDVIKTADYVIDMGPEGGKEGGMVIAHGTPEKIVTVAQSYTGKYLKKYLQ